MDVQIHFLLQKQRDHTVRNIIPPALGGAVRKRHRLQNSARRKKMEMGGRNVPAKSGIRKRIRERVYSKTGGTVLIKNRIPAPFSAGGGTGLCSVQGKSKSVHIHGEFAANLTAGVGGGVHVHVQLTVHKMIRHGVGDIGPRSRCGIPGERDPLNDASRSRIMKVCSRNGPLKFVHRHVIRERLPIRA